MNDYRIEAATKEEWAERALKAEAARDKAIHQLSEISRKLGEAEGKLAASEMAGIVEGWKARALTAETEAEKLREALRPFADIAEAYDPPDNDDHVTPWDHRHAPTIGMLRCARAALEGSDDEG